MDLIIDTRGQVRCIYDEVLDLAALGKVSIKRASYVEPGVGGRRIAMLCPMNGPHLGPYDRRSDALKAE